MEIGLVSCTKTKKEVEAKPREMYEPSTLFRKARSYVEKHHDEWYILSAKYHLLEPEGTVIEPYDETLTDATVSQRRKWAETVVDQLAGRGLLNEDITLVIHAGKAYYSELLELIADEPVQIEIPTEGLMIGETLAWYNEHL